MSELYILYDNTGKYVGSHYDVGPPGGFESWAAGYRKLTYPEINSINAFYNRYIYNEGALRKLREIHLGVNTSLLEIDGETKVSVTLKAAEDSGDTSDLIGTEIEVTINSQKINIPFGEMILLNPEHPGTYSITLSDNRFYSEKSKYVVAVVDQIEEV
jgi:hypothetical protein